MTELGPVSVIVVTASEDNVEKINSTLRKGGVAAHCVKVPEGSDLADTLATTSPEIVFVFDQEGDASIANVVRACHARQQNLRVVAVRAEIDEQEIAQALSEGANDLVSFDQLGRLQKVALREVQAFRYFAELDAARSTAKDYREQLTALVEGSADAMIYAAEGIVVHTNPAWLELFGYEDQTGLIGLPLMDQFHPESHVALKGALRACQTGKWSGHTLKVVGMGKDAKKIPIEMEMELSEFDGEPCVRLQNTQDNKTEQELQNKLDSAMNVHPSWGIYRRSYFLQVLGELIKDPPKGGIRALAYIKPDDFEQVQEDIGALAADEILKTFAGFLRVAAQPKDTYGRLGGHEFGIFLSRGTNRDAEAWARQLCASIANHVFEISGKTISLTCSAGIAVEEPDEVDLDALIRDAQSAHKKCRETGGNGTEIYVPTHGTLKLRMDDSIWVERIKHALMHNRFRLVQLPIVSIHGEQTHNYDVMVRMLDTDGNEILPNEFLPAAERNDLMKHIDRWVLGQTAALASKHTESRYFVRLSDASITDDSLLGWFNQQLTGFKTNPAQIVFEVAQKIIQMHVAESSRIAKAGRALGCKFAVENFGLGDTPLRVLDKLDADFVKIDGSLMQGITSDSILQERIRGYIENARNNNIKTIAERVDDANTMAVLWQLGIDFVQGYYVHEPEVVIEA